MIKVTGKNTAMPERRKSIGDYISVITVTVLFIVILSLVVFAARGYQFAQETQDANGNTRAVLSYVINAVRDNEAADIVVEDRAGTECLILVNEGYEQRIYFTDGTVYEEYCMPEAAVTPDNALEIGHAEKFDFALDDDGLLEISSDLGASYVNTERHK